MNLRVLQSVVLSASMLLTAFAPLRANAAQKGEASLSLEYQFIRTGEFDSSIGDIDIGRTDAHVFMLSGHYAINDRLRLSARLPYIKKRHEGAFAHNPGIELTEFPEADQSVIDNGDFHSDWQDIYLQMSYETTYGPLTLAPYVAVGLPTNDYPFYGHAAVGRNLWHVPLGVGLSFTPYFSDFLVNADIAYVFTEKSLGVDVSHWLINFDVGYYVTPSIIPRVFATIKQGTRGLNFPQDFDVAALNDENWYFHDRTIKHNFVNAGIGVDWIVNDKYTVSGSVLTMVRPDQVNTVDYGLSLGITRRFSPRGMN